MRNFKLREKHVAIALACTAAVLANPMIEKIAQAEAAQEYVLDQIVVTATRIPVKAMEANANIYVINRDDLERQHYSDLTEALKTVPGVTVTRYGNGAGYEQAEGVLINGSSRIVVLIDGTRANMNGSEFSPFSFGAYKAMANVERIEILKGSASTLYGSDAKGGVINIITKKPDGGNKTSLSVLNGSYDTEQYRLDHSQSSGDYNFSIGVQKDKSGTYKDANDMEIPSSMSADTLNLKINKTINDKENWSFMYDKYTADYMYSGTNFATTQRHNGTADNYNWRFLYNNQINTNNNNQISLYSQNTKTIYDGWLMDLQTIGFSDQFTTKLTKGHNLVSGIDYYEEKIKDYKEKDYPGMPGIKYSGKSLNNKSLYVQDIWDLNANWNLTSGLRYDNHSKAGGQFSPAVTLNYKWNDTTNMYTSYKEYFAAPSQYQYFSPYGNENLDPESGHTYEVGFQHSFDTDSAVTIHAFKRKAEDVIAFAYGYPVTASNPYGGKYVNIDAETSHGWDIQFKKDFSESWNAFVGYTHTVVKSQPRNGTESINRYIPKGEFNIGVNYKQENYDASLIGRGVIDRQGEGKVNYPAFPSSTYWVWDAAFNYKIKPSMKVFVKVNNIFDKFYAEHSNVKWGNPGEWYTSPGRNYQVGLQYNF